MAKITRIGFGQVEPNHLSAQRTSQIYAQLPAHIKSATLTDDTITILENGQFVKYDYLNKEVNFTGAGEWMMVFNEVKLYDDAWRESYKDFAMQSKNYTPGGDIEHNGLGPFTGTIVPRVIKTNVGDIYTTNALYVGNTDGKTEISESNTAVTEIAEGDLLTPGTNGFLKAAAGTENMIWQVVKITTMPDMQAAVKLMRIK